MDLLPLLPSAFASGKLISGSARFLTRAFCQRCISVGISERNLFRKINNTWRRRKQTNTLDG
jgi:hypothetical protein